MEDDKVRKVKLGTQRVNANGKRTFVLNKDITLLLDGKELNIPYNTAYFFDVDESKITNEKALAYIKEKNIQRDVVAYLED